MGATGQGVLLIYPVAFSFCLVGQPAGEGGNGVTQPHRSGEKSQSSPRPSNQHQPSEEEHKM